MLSARTFTHVSRHACKQMRTSDKVANRPISRQFSQFWDTWTDDDAKMREHIHDEHNMAAFYFGNTKVFDPYEGMRKVGGSAFFTKVFTTIITAPTELTHNPYTSLYYNYCWTQARLKPKDRRIMLQKKVEFVRSKKKVQGLVDFIKFKKDRGYK
jgi:hypothetical protein